MSLVDATYAVYQAANVCDEVEDMITAKAVGTVLDDALLHAEEMLDYADEEMATMRSVGI